MVLFLGGEGGELAMVLAGQQIHHGLLVCRDVDPA